MSKTRNTDNYNPRPSLSILSTNTEAKTTGGHWSCSGIEVHKINFLLPIPRTFHDIYQITSIIEAVIQLKYIYLWLKYLYSPL